MNPAQLHGYMAEFSDADELLAAARAIHRAGYRKVDAYTPYPVDDLADSLGHRFTAIPFIVLIGGIMGGLGGYFLQWYAMAYDYPLNIGGKPLNSWPMYIPVTFELTILCASLAGFLGFIILNKFPQPYHPVFNAPEFEFVSRDKFMLCISSDDPKFDRNKTRRDLSALRPDNLIEVPK
jgi:hypothetical protein